MEESIVADKFPFNSEKFKELICYVAKQSEGDPAFGSIKLNKILFYADFAAYRDLGQPITGACYQKLREGPAPRELLAARDELIASGDVYVEERPYFTGIQKRLAVSERRALDRELFEPKEIEIVDSVIRAFYGKTAREVSDFSHREPGWALAENRETIPYETAWISADPLDQDAEEAGMRFVMSRR